MVRVECAAVVVPLPRGVSVRCLSAQLRDVSDALYLACTWGCGTRLRQGARARGREGARCWTAREGGSVSRVLFTTSRYFHALRDLGVTDTRALESLAPPFEAF